MPKCHFRGGKKTGIEVPKRALRHAVWRTDVKTQPEITFSGSVSAGPLWHRSRDASDPEPRLKKRFQIFS